MIRLHDVIEYWRCNKDRGNTTASIEVALGMSSSPVYYLARDNADKGHFKRNYKDKNIFFISVDDTPEVLMGRRYPLVVDHAAISKMYDYEMRILSGFANKDTNEIPRREEHLFIHGTKRKIKNIVYSEDNDQLVMNFYALDYE